MLGAASLDNPLPAELSWNFGLRSVRNLAPLGQKIESGALRKKEVKSH